MALYETTMLDNKAFPALASFDAEVPAWIAALRKPAKEALLKTGWPSRKDEDWRYTSLRGLKDTAFSWSHTKGLIDKSVIASFLKIDAWPVVMIDGVYDSTQSFINELPRGLVIKNLKSAWHDHESVLKDVISHEIHEEAHAFNLLNKAFLLNGVYIELASELVLDKPIHVLFINTKKPKPYCLFPRLVLNMGPSSMATLVTSYEHQDGGTYLHDGVLNINLQDNATLRHYTTQKASPAAYHYEETNVDLARDASYRAFNLALGSKLCRQELNISLNGEGSNVKADGVYLVDQQRQIDNYSHIAHKVPHCQSSQRYKGILTDQSRGVFSGKIRVHKDAQKTNAVQMNHNLLLSNEAEIDTKPQLLIDADDVKCSHGATIGQLKEDEIFYLESRGIDRGTATSMLSKAFVTELLFDIEDVAYQRGAHQTVETWVESL